MNLGAWSGLEAIAFQKNSPLATEMIAIFDRVLIRRNSITKDISARINGTIKYVRDTMVGELSKCIEKHTGLSVSTIKLSKYISYEFAVIMELGDGMGVNAHDFIAKYSGLPPDQQLAYLRRKYKLQTTTYEEISNLSKQLNHDTGKLDNNMLGKRQAAITLFFDPYAAFLSKETLHSSAEGFTSEETTAIVLHEIGHMLSAIEYATNKFFKMEAFKSALDYFNKNASLDERIKLLKHTPISSKEINTVVSSVVSVYEAIENKKEDYVFSVLGFVFASAVTLLLNLFCIILIPASLLQHMLMPLFEHYGYVLAGVNKSKKQSDFSGTHKQLSFCEELADEYVTRHGLGSHLISALQKLYRNSRASCIAGMLMDSSLAWTIAKAGWLTSVLLNGDVTYHPSYGDLSTRGERVMEKTLNVFKQELPAHMLDIYINEYDNLKRLNINKDAGRQLEEFMGYTYGWLKYAITFLPRMLLTGNFNAEYEKLFRTTEKLQANLLFYRTAKLQQLLNTKK